MSWSRASCPVQQAHIPLSSHQAPPRSRGLCCRRAECTSMSRPIRGRLSESFSNAWKARSVCMWPGRQTVSCRRLTRRCGCCLWVPTGTARCQCAKARRWCHCCRISGCPPGRLQLLRPINPRLSQSWCSGTR